MAVNLVGKRFGRLLVIKDTGRNDGKKPPRRLWKCLCDCGNTVEVITSNLNRGTTRSCGCLAKESARKTIEQNTANNSSNFKKIKEKATKTYESRYVKEKTNIKNLDSAINRNNTSGYKGVSWDKGRSRWLARIKFQKKNIHLGRYKDINDAIKARQEAEEKYFKPMLEKYGNIDKQEVR